MDNTADRPVEKLSEGSDQQQFIDKFHELLALGRDPKITLTNIYKEMPITHPATLWEVKGRHIELETCELQLAAISQCNEVYIVSPLVEEPVLGQLDSIDIRHCTVRLHNFCYKELFVNRRSAVRVRFKRPINIVAVSGEQKINGMIHDISLEGCCLNTLIRRGLEGDQETHIELKVIAPATGEELHIEVPAAVIRIAGDSPPFKCVFQFNHTQHTEQLLSVYINQRQHEILKELRETI